MLKMVEAARKEEKEEEERGGTWIGVEGILGRG